MSLRWPLALIAAALAVVAMLGLAGRSEQGDASDSLWKIRAGMAAPVFRAVDTTGDSLSLNQWHGQYVLLDFWFTTCPPCLDELPRIRTLQQKYRGRLVVVGVSIDRNRAAFDRFVQREKMDWPQVLDVLDNEGALQSLYGAQYYPSYWLVNPDGQVAAHGRRVVDLVEAAGLRYEYH